MIAHFTRKKNISSLSHSFVDKELPRPATQCHGLHRTLRTLVAQKGLHTENMLHTTKKLQRLFRHRQAANGTASSHTSTLLLQETYILQTQHFGHAPIHAATDIVEIRVGCINRHAMPDGTGHAPFDLRPAVNTFQTAKE